GERAVGVDGQLDGLGVTGERLVDRVVDHFVDEVVQPLRADPADVHVRPLADRFEALQDLDAFGRIFTWGGRALSGLLVLLNLQNHTSNRVPEVSRKIGRKQGETASLSR